MLKKKHAFLSIPPDVWICLLLVTVTFAVYIQVKDFDFVLLDDNVYVTENPMVTNGLSLKSVNSAFFSTRGATWMPLTWISFMIDYELFGLDPGGYKRARWRGLWRMQIQDYLIAAVQNIQTLMREKERRAANAVRVVTDKYMAVRARLLFVFRQISLIILCGKNIIADSELALTN